MSNAGWPTRLSTLIILCVFTSLLRPFFEPSLLAAKTLSSSPQDRLVKTDEAYAAFTVGAYLMEKGALRSALKYLETAWDASDHHPLVGIRLAEGYFQVTKLDECEKIVDELLKKNEQDADALLLKARVFYVRGDKAGCATYLEKLAVQDPSSFEILQLLGKVYYQMGNDRKALEAYRKAIELDPEYPYMHFRYGLLLMKFNENAEAEKAFEKALTLNPDFDESAMELSKLWMENNRYARAESLLTSVLAREPGNDDALLTLSRLYLDQGDLDAGIRILEAPGGTNTPGKALL
jgi:tetratricopeptide (TPR) repeat protein